MSRTKTELPVVLTSDPEIQGLFKTMQTLSIKHQNCKVESNKWKLVSVGCYMVVSVSSSTRAACKSDKMKSKRKI